MGFDTYDGPYTNSTASILYNGPNQQGTFSGFKFSTETDAIGNTVLGEEHKEIIVPSCSTLTITDPTNSTVCEGETATHTTGIISGAAYQWSKRTDGITFTGLIDNAVYQNTTTNSLTVKTSTGLDNEQYRVELNSAGLTATSNSATLSVNTLPKVLSLAIQPSFCEAEDTPILFINTGGTLPLAYTLMTNKLTDTQNTITIKYHTLLQ
jgi:hypothetical protein